MGRSAGAVASASTGLASALLSIAAGACCVSPVLAPIIVSLLGASGAVWAAGLKPYGWWILGASAASLGLGFWTMYRPRRACDAAVVSDSGRVLQLIARISLFVGAAFWIAGASIRVVVS